jgi:hypothetical protein
MRRKVTCRVLAIALIGVASFALAPLAILAAEPMAVGAQQPLRDPWVPPEARNPSTAPPLEGAALRAEVEHRLRHAFDAADVNRSGSP